MLSSSSPAADAAHPVSLIKEDKEGRNTSLLLLTMAQWLGVGPLLWWRSSNKVLCMCRNVKIHFKMEVTFTERLLRLDRDERRKEYRRQDFVPLEKIPSWRQECKFGCYTSNCVQYIMLWILLSFPLFFGVMPYKWICMCFIFNLSFLVNEEEEEQELTGAGGGLSDKVSLYKGDITVLEVDAIVNAGKFSISFCWTFWLILCWRSSVFKWRFSALCWQEWRSADTQKTAQLIDLILKYLPWSRELLMLLAGYAPVPLLQSTQG